MSLFLFDFLIHPQSLWERARLPRRWLVVGAATFGMLASFGVSTSISVFMKPFEVEFGWMRAEIALVYGLLSAGAAIGGVIVGFVFDRINARLLTVFGATVTGAGLLMLSWASSLLEVQAIYLAIGVFGFSCLYTPLIATVGLWFDRGRGVAMGIVTAGGTMGQGVTPLIVQPLIEAVGWREAFLVLGAGYLLVLTPLMLVVAKPPTSQAHEGEHIRDRSQTWTLPPVAAGSWLGLAALFCCASMAIPVVHLVAMMGDRGMTASHSGALILTTMMAASAGRVCFGIVSDRIGALLSYSLAVLMQTVTVYWFVELQSLPALYALALVFGLGYGGVMTTLTLCVRAAVPARHAGFATAVIGLLAWSGMGIGGYEGGYCFDLTGSYSASFASAAIAGIINLVIVAGLAIHLRWHARIAALTAHPHPGAASGLSPPLAAGLAR